MSNYSLLTLKELDLTRAVHSGNVVQPGNGWTIVFHLLSNSSFKKLKLGGNSITDDAIPSMVACLNSMTSLTTVDLWSCTDVTDSGCSDYFSLLKNNTSLRECGMSHSYEEHHPL